MLLASSRRPLRVLLGLALLLAPSLKAQEQDPDYVLTVDGPPSAGFGDTIEVRVLLDNNGVPLAGWQIGVIHDPAGLELIDVQPGEATLASQGGQEPNVFNQLICENGWLGYAVVDLIGMEALPPGQDLEMYVATYQVSNPAPDNAALEFCDCISLGCNPAEPPHATVLVDAATQEIIPIQVGLTIQLEECASHLRSDSNGDGLLDLADALHLLGYISGAGPAPVPLGGGDANDDNTINVADPIYLLNFLFTGGPAPAEADCDL